MPIFWPVTTGWISVNVNDHHINSQPRNTESSAPLVLMFVSWICSQISLPLANTVLSGEVKYHVHIDQLL